MSTMPKLNFSKWMSWVKRLNFAGGENPGIYMISITEKDLEGKDPQYQDVVYIGMTNSRGGLFNRWQQFDNSIKSDKITGNGHSGGDRVYEEMKCSYDDWKKKLNLFVCGQAIQCNTTKADRTPDDLVKMGEIRYLECLAISEFKKAMDKEPKYNKQ